MYTTDGTKFTDAKGSQNFRIYWDGDLQDELLDGIGTAPSAMKIEHWNGTGFDRLVSTDDRWGPWSALNNNGTKSNPTLVADILGDWREEMILRQSDNSALIVYTTTTPTTHRLYTLMHAPHYRAAISWQNTAYTQPPHLGFWLGAGVDKAPKPDITLVGAGTTSITPRRTSAPRASGSFLDLSEYSHSASLRITAIDISGRRQILASSAAGADLSALPSGAWIVEVRDGADVLVRGTIVRP